jgi:hypothetical protein
MENPLKNDKSVNDKSVNNKSINDKSVNEKEILKIEPPESKVEEKPDTENVTNLKLIYSNIAAGQQIKGKLLLEDCEALIKARDHLYELFTPDEDDNIGVATQESVNSLDVLTKSCQLLQSTGVFSIDGSLLLLKALRSLDGAISDIKDPALKIKELNDQFKHIRSHKKSSKK